MTLPSFPNLSLSLEQQFDLRKFQDSMSNLKREELEELLIMIIRQKMAHENISKGLIKEMINRETEHFIQG